MKTVLEEYTKMSNQNKNLTLENKALTAKQNSMKSTAEQVRLLMETIGLPAIEGNTSVSPPLEPPPSAAPARKRRKSGTPKAEKDTTENITANSSTPNLPNVKNKNKTDATAKKSKKRPRSDSNENPPGTSKQTVNSSSYWDAYGNIFAPSSSGSSIQQNDQKSKTNEAFEQKKKFGKWKEAGNSN